MRLAESIREDGDTSRQACNTQQQGEEEATNEVRGGSGMRSFIHLRETRRARQRRPGLQLRQPRREAAVGLSQ
jgi:hypothetical protein